MLIGIDPVNTCNLRCTCCERGRYLYALKKPENFSAMPLQMLERILDKLIAEVDSPMHVRPFGACDPLLHPHAVEFLNVIGRRNLPLSFATNLNIKLDWEQLVRVEGLREIRTSISGVTQECYGRAHRGGDIEMVKQNLNCLVAAKERTASPVRIMLFCHRYQDNHAEVQKAKELARDMGIDFFVDEAHALHMDYESIFGEYNLDNQEREKLQRARDFHLSRIKVAHLKIFVNPTGYCDAHKNELRIDHAGNLYSCCLMGQGPVRLGPFLEMSRDKWQDMKANNDYCRRCMDSPAGRMSGIYDIINRLLVGAGEGLGYADTDAFVKALEEKNVNWPASPLPSLLYLFGAGALAIPMLRIMGKWGINVPAIIDDDKEKQGSTIDGLRVISRQEAKDKHMAGGALVVVSTASQSGDICDRIAGELLTEGLPSAYSLSSMARQYPQLLKLFLRVTHGEVTTAKGRTGAY